MRCHQQPRPSPPSNSDGSDIEGCFDIEDEQEETDVDTEPTDVDTDVDTDDEACEIDSQDIWELHYRLNPFSREPIQPFIVRICLP